MRRRLLVSTLAVAVLLLGLPLAFVISRLQVSEASQQVRRDAATLARSLQTRVNDGQAPDAAQVGRSLPDRYVIIKQYSAGRTVIGKQPPAGDTIRAESVTRDFSVTVEADDSTVGGRVARALLLISALALLAVGVAVALAILQARRLTRPLEELARAADRLGSGDARPLGRRYGVPELDQVAEGLDGSAQRISDLLSAGRDFAADASHQLRTPLTALSMRLEEMIAPRRTLASYARRARRRSPRQSGWPRSSGSCSAGLRAGQWPAPRRSRRSTTSLPSRSSNGIRRSAAWAGSSR